MIRRAIISFLSALSISWCWCSLLLLLLLLLEQSGVDDVVALEIGNVVHVVGVVDENPSTVGLLTPQQTSIRKKKHKEKLGIMGLKD
jgi:hypothetical protein